jgi:hypothetical protein
MYHETLVIMELAQNRKYYTRTMIEENNLEGLESCGLEAVSDISAQRNVMHGEYREYCNLQECIDRIPGVIAILWLKWPQKRSQSNEHLFYHHTCSSSA